MGFWDLSEETIYCYDVEASELSGSCDSSEFRDSSLSIMGVEFEDEPAFKIRDTSGGTNKTVGYLAPDETVWESTSSD